MKRFLLPLGVFIALMVFLAIGLRLNPREIPSPFIGKPAPAFKLTQLQAPDKTISPADMKGQVWLLNVWASWCVSCREEHPVLMDFAKANVVPIVGLNYKDKRDDGMGWLNQFGNPYTVSGFDNDGRVGIDYGVYGVPETFVIDKNGVIRMKYTGPITPQAIAEKLLPMIKELQRA
ncbi:MAG TPA: DsbE family thiol:disulfide interchange protein [Noviherbaspirillum sp.]|uniref:DsbE family thiol:disulfide interchange protein n=1 Tax=Noviherbaspirillum sp. TaxID=1926288 RepID=UPI002B4A26A0|nr:DsbE family thiol:disulfide interchange protein [Noviherbaspirillum sp.]HJV88633.1 DsbE family thiol:disulfide interchange protein [Noviherbaspirillum sp.]